MRTLITDSLNIYKPVAIDLENRIDSFVRRIETVLDAPVYNVDENIMYLVGAFGRLEYFERLRRLDPELKIIRNALVEKPSGVLAAAHMPMSFYNIVYA